MLKEIAALFQSCFIFNLQSLFLLFIASYLFFCSVFAFQPGYFREAYVCWLEGTSEDDLVPVEEWILPDQVTKFPATFQEFSRMDIWLYLWVSFCWSFCFSVTLLSEWRNVFNIYSEHPMQQHGVISSCDIICHCWEASGSIILVTVLQPFVGCSQIPSLNFLYPRLNKLTLLSISLQGATDL